MIFLQGLREGEREGEGRGGVLKIQLEMILRDVDRKMVQRVSMRVEVLSQGGAEMRGRGGGGQERLRLTDSRR
jgi:hypothetical protein